jgi:hypothetical protein
MTLKARIGNEELTIDLDQEPESPREWDNIGTMLCYHSRYELGDKKGDFEDPEDLMAYLRKTKAVVLNLRLLDHSGLSMSTSNTWPYDDKWDAMNIGLIFVTYDKIKKEYGKKILSGRTLALARAQLEQEVKTYDHWLRGDILYYSIAKLTICNLGEEHREVIDSVCGFYSVQDILNNIDQKWKTVALKEA